MAAFFSAWRRISSLEREHQQGQGFKRVAHSSRFKTAQQTTHSTQSSFPIPSVCHTCFSSSLRPVMDILVPPPFSAEFFEILPNCRKVSRALFGNST